MIISQKKSDKLDEILDAVSQNPRTDTDSIADASKRFPGVAEWFGGRLGDFAYYCISNKTFICTINDGSQTHTTKFVVN